MLKRITIGLLGLAGSLLLCFLFWLYNPWCWIGQRSAVPSCDTVGSIAPPPGYRRTPADEAGFASFLRSLPLAVVDSVLRLYDGTLADGQIQRYCYRCLDLPLLSESEQCADVCIRLRTEYLYEGRRFFEIHFDDTQGHRMQYWRGGRRRWIERYLRYVYELANTESLARELPVRPLTELRIGDVLVYDAHSRDSVRYGHAMIVVDMAEGQGERLVMLAQGSTPACSPHLLRNLQEPGLSPWFRLDTTAEVLDFGFASYYRNELHAFE